MTSSARLRAQEDVGQPVGPHAEQGHALDVVELDRRPDRLEQPRQDADLDAERLGEPDRVKDVVLGVGLARRDDHALDLLDLEGQAELRDRAERVRVRLLPMEGQRHAADDTALEARRLLELGSDVARGLVGAEHEDPLDRRRAGGDRTGERAAEDHRDGEHRPEAEDLVAAQRAVDESGRAEPEQEGAQRRDVEDARRLVERRLAQEVLVAVVEADRLVDQDDERKGEQQLGAGRVIADEERGRADRHDRRKDVREGEPAAVTRIALERLAEWPCLCDLNSAVLGAPQSWQQRRDDTGTTDRCFYRGLPDRDIRAQPAP